MCHTLPGMKLIHLILCVVAVIFPLLAGCASGGGGSSAGTTTSEETTASTTGAPGQEKEGYGYYTKNKVNKLHAR